MNILGGLIDNGITGSIFDSNKKKGFKAQPVNDPYTAEYLAGIDASGQGATKRINDTFDRNGNTQQARLWGGGWGNSSLAGSYTLGNEDRRSQALLDLDNQLFAQRLQAKQAGANSALNLYGITTQARNNYNNRQQQQRDANAQLFGSAIGAGARIATAPATGGASLLGGFGGAARTDPYSGLYNNNQQPFMGYA